MGFARLKISTRLALLLAAMVLLTVAIGVVGLSGMRQANAGLNTVYLDRVIPLKQINLVSDAYAVDVVDAAHKVRDGAMTPAQGLESLAQSRKSVDANWTAYLATPLLPQEVQQQGISVEKSSSSFLLVAGFISDNPNTAQDDISDYVASNVKDSISRLNGVGDVQLFGAQYAMRVWLDSNLLNKYNLTPVDVINQLQVQNDQIAAGQLGGTPAVAGQQLNASIIAQTRLKDPQEFGKVTLRVNADGSVVHLKDVARIELGGENYNVVAKINGKPASGLGIKLATGANALDTAAAIKAKLAELHSAFSECPATG